MRSRSSSLYWWLPIQPQAGAQAHVAQSLCPSFARLELMPDSPFRRGQSWEGEDLVILTDSEGRMSVMKSLWSSVQGDPVFMRRVNGWLTIFWIVMIPVSLATGWVSSVVYVSALSLWALVSGHWSAWQAARVEVAQQEDVKRREQEDIAGDVVDRLIHETDVTPSPDTTPPPFPAADPPLAPPGWYKRADGPRWWTGTEWDLPDLA
jgi:hypothetical protein